MRDGRCRKHRRGRGIGRGDRARHPSQGVAALHPGLPSPSALTGCFGVGAVPQIRNENRGRRTGHFQIRYNFPQSVTDTGIGRPLGLPGSVTKTGTVRVRTPSGVRATMVPKSVSDTEIGRPLGLPGSVTKTDTARGSHAVRCAGNNGSQIRYGHGNRQAARSAGLGNENGHGTGSHAVRCAGNNGSQIRFGHGNRQAARSARLGNENGYGAGFARRQVCGL